MANLIKEYRPYGVAVTDLSAQLWCEKQFEFGLEMGRVETKAMTKGKERHTDLHEEVAVLVEVEPKTPVDLLALKLYNCQIGSKGLISEGITREVPVFGKFNSLFINGIIDELILNDEGLSILDTKTRQRNSMPSEAQKRTTRFQLMLYNKLMADLVAGKFSTDQLLSFYGFDDSDEISEDFKEQFNDVGDEIQSNLKELAQSTFGLFQELPHPEKKMQIRYEYQKNRKLIKVDEFSYSENVFQRNFNFVEEFWLGKRKAKPVGAKNGWKCNYCEFSDICEEKP